MNSSVIDPRERFPNEPDPAFYVQLTEPNRGYRPGDSVSGRVVCQTDVEDETRFAVHVVLEGKAAVVVDSPSAYDPESHSRVPLVWQHAELSGEEPVLAGPIGYEGATTKSNVVMKFVSFPFCFQIPEVAQETRTDDTFDNPFWTTAFDKRPSLFQRKPGHELPPTLAFGPRGSHTELEGYVAYRILAVKSTTRREQRNGQWMRILKPILRAQHPFWMAGGTNAAKCPSGTMTSSKAQICQPKRAAPPTSTDRSLARRAIKSVLSASICELRLQTEVSVPECIYLGDDFEIAWSIGAPTWTAHHAGSRPDLSWLPRDTNVRSLTVEVNRAIGARTTLHESWFQDNIWMKEFAPNEALPGEDDPFGRTEDGWPIVRLRCGPLPAQIVPSCGALNFYYQYKVHVSAKVECAGDKWEALALLTPHFARRAPEHGSPDAFADMGPYAPSANDVPGREMGSTTSRQGKRAITKAAYMVLRRH